MIITEEPIIEQAVEDFEKEFNIKVKLFANGEKKDIKKLRESSYAGNRIIVADPRGEIDCDSLLHFFEEKIEPGILEMV